MKIIINGMEMITKHHLHELLARELALPDYYGHNLDALWDLLVTYPYSITILLNNKEQFMKQLGSYGDAFIRLLEDLEADNQNITIIME
jgi:ribonuclease inhibitor